MLVTKLLKTEIHIPTKLENDSENMCSYLMEAKENRKREGKRENMRFESRCIKSYQSMRETGR